MNLALAQKVGHLRSYNSAELGQVDPFEIH